ncbi:hypothetical protein GALMADRAFT_238781 [Galerina marginata CBS 339.88]|uniref:Rhodopsin domain-containing protein n=1 Tax=Galerina marginata (strain CBS 339.88) TaxID=685588 RepID=A0A067TIJ3_GALM3|nr:hypothetical protein GALMADRAFT_238781 [Galerina marginata CBS 339.88]
MLPRQSTLAWSIVITIFHCLAIISTLFRVYHRARKGQLWYDDYIAIIPLVFDCIYVVTFWVSLDTRTYVTYWHITKFILSFFFMFILNFTVIWCVSDISLRYIILKSLVPIRFSRISLTLSLARIFPPGHLARRISLSLTGLYFLFYCLSVSLTTVLCQGGGLPWDQIDPDNCLKGPDQIPGAGIVNFTTDLIADILLFVAPSFMLRKIKMPKNQRRLIVAAFSASILTLFSAVIVCIFWYGRMDLGPDVVVLRLMIAQIEWL